jgi:RNA polymerase sigma-70 factor (ECF subfamily)
MLASNLNRWSRPLEPSSAELHRAADGDQQAFKILVERYQGMVYSIAYSVLGNSADAEDAAQETFLRLYRKLGQFRGEASFATWLYRLAVRVAVDEQRRRQRNTDRYDLAAAIASATGGGREGSDQGVGGTVAEPVADAEAQALERLDAVALATALRELPADYRLPVILRDVHGLAYKEIAATTGRPLGTVKAMVHRGRGALRLRLRAAGILGEER